MTLTAKTRSLGRLSRIAIGTLSAAILLATCASAMALRMEIGAPAGSPAPYTNHDAPTQSAQVSSSVMVGNLIRKIPPVYPQSAREAKISGAVRLSAVIGKDGTVERLTVESGPGELRASALDAVRQWLYKPYLLNGKPTEVQTTITITYSLQN